MRLDHLTTPELLGLRGQVQETLSDLLRLVPEEAPREDPEPQRPGLAGRSQEALQLLLTPLDDLVRDLVLSARDSAGLSQAVAPAAKGEMAYALRRLDLPLESAGRHFSEDVASTWDTHLQRWLRRHHEVVDRVIRDLGAAGRTAALGELGLDNAEFISETSGEWARLPGRFEGAGDGLAAEMRTGTMRSLGLAGILDHSTRTLGVAALHLQRLHDTMRPALERLAGQVTWTAYAEGYRLAAINGTHALLRAADAMPAAGLALIEATISESVLGTLPRYRWSGPQDEQTCGPCNARKQQVVYALSVDEMPCCQTVCRQGHACRHHWMKL